MKIIIDIPNNDDRQVYIPPKQPYHSDWPITQDGDGFGYDPCRDCSNNPRNGGSGVCHCTLPYIYGPYKVTC